MTTNNKNRKLTPKQERFALNLFKGLSQRESYLQAGYSNNSNVAIVDNHAYELANKGEIMERLSELQEETKNTAIAEKNEAGEVATEILRSRFSDFDLENPTKEQLKSASVREVVKTVHYGKDEEMTVAYKLKLESPLAAIDRLADLYSWKKGVQINDNRTYNILVQGDEARDRFTKLLTGKRPEIIEGETPQDKGGEDGTT